MEEIEMWLARDFDDALQLIIGVKPVKLQFMWGYPMDGDSIELNSSFSPKFNGRTKNRQKLNS